MRRLSDSVTPDMTSIIAANVNNGTLCSDNHTSCGKFVTRLAIVAPAPSDTSKAGRAQQISVPNEPSNATVSMMIVRR